MSSSSTKSFCYAFVISMVAVPSWSAQLPTISKPMSSSEVRQMYSGKTWTWKDKPSGIYFSPSGSLLALEDVPGGRLGRGQWRVDPKGQLCVSILWKGSVGPRSRYQTCWIHRRVGSVIWKQHVFRSQWYSLFGRSNEAGRINSGNRLNEIMDRHQKQL